MSPVHLTSSVTNTEHSAYSNSERCRCPQTAMDKLFDTTFIFLTRLKDIALIIFRRLKCAVWSHVLCFRL